MPCYLQRVKRVFRLKCRGRSLMRCATISSRTDTLTVTNRSQWPVFMSARRVLREIVCRIAGANQQNSRSVTVGKGSNLWARSFGMHESSRLNMSFKCSGAFNIIYIMRTIIAKGEKQPPSVNQSYNQRPALADAMSIPIVNSGT